MHDYLATLIPWGVQAVLWVQQVASPVLDSVFHTASILGLPQVYVGVLLAIYWCVHKPVARKLAYLFVFSEYANGFVKDALGLPRPYEVDGRVRAPWPEPSPSFPSGHAQAAVVFWCTLSKTLRRRWAWLLALALVLVISFSRIYLGVHGPQDIIGGWLIGLVLLVVYAWAGRWKFPRRVRFSLGFKLLLSLTVPVTLLLLHPTQNAAKLMGLGIGLAAGFELEQKYVRCSVDGHWLQRLARYAVGTATLLALFLGLGQLPQSGVLSLTVSHAIAGVWVGFGAPWLFVATRLSRREPQRAPAASTTAR